MGGLSFSAHFFLADRVLRYGVRRGICGVVLRVAANVKKITIIAKMMFHKNVFRNIFNGVRPLSWDHETVFFI